MVLQARGRGGVGIKIGGEGNYLGVESGCLLSSQDGGEAMCPPFWSWKSRRRM